MWLKVAIVLLFIALLLSLSSAYWFLMRDKNAPEVRQRTWYSLGIRLLIAILLIGLLAYGVLTGQLVSQAPWDIGRLG